MHEAVQVFGLAQHGGQDLGIVLVCHELTPAQRLGLVDGIIGLVIQTPLITLTDTAVRLLLQALEPGQEPVFGRPHILPFEIYTPENV